MESSSVTVNARREALLVVLAKLKKETDELTRNYPIDEALAMEDGKPRRGATWNERLAREKFARMREISALLKGHEYR